MFEWKKKKNELETEIQLKADATSKRKTKSAMKWKATNEIGKNAANNKVEEE